MKNSLLLTVGMVLLLGCTPKATTVKSECQPIQRELGALQFDHRMEQGGKIANTLTLRNQYSKAEGHLDQRVKVLQMRLRECERRAK